MYVLIVFLAFSGDVHVEHTTARVAGAYATRAQCEAASMEWWDADRRLAEMPDWRQITPGHCDPLPLVG